MTHSKADEFNPFDPAGIFKGVRDANIEAWSKFMTEMVNTDAYAESTGAMLDAWLSSSGPFRKAIETSISQSMAQLNMPTRDDVSRLGERLTNIEMRLDDMEAMLADHVKSSNNGGE